MVGRVTELVAAGMEPARIIVFSFTLTAAGEARRRLRDVDINDVCVTTMHSFCGSVAGILRTRLGLPMGFASSKNTVISDVVRLCETVPAAFEAMTSDFDYLCVDEAQDNNEHQHGLCQLLLRRVPTAGAMAVGDPNQSIFGFCGARPFLFNDFFAGLRPPVEVQMSINYRCPWGVVAMANTVTRRIALMRHLNVRSSVINELPDSVVESTLNKIAYMPMRSVVRACGRECHPETCPECEDLRERTSPRLTAHASKTKEVAFVATRIHGLFARGVRPGNIAILHRTNDALTAYFSLISGYGINAVRTCDGGGDSGNHVALSTVHGSKGSEWPYVFLVSATDAMFPLIRSDVHVSDSVERELEELRLMYVALTRTKTELNISFVSTRDSRLSRFIGVKELAMCRHSLSKQCLAKPDDEPNNLVEDSDEESDDLCIHFEVSDIVRIVGEQTVRQWQAEVQVSEHEGVTLHERLSIPGCVPLGCGDKRLEHPQCIACLNAYGFHGEFIESLVSVWLTVSRGLAPQFGPRVVRQLLAPALSTVHLRALKAADCPALRRFMLRIDLLNRLAQDYGAMPNGGNRPASIQQAMRDIQVSALAPIVDAVGEYAVAAVRIYRDVTGQAPLDGIIGSARARDWADRITALTGAIPSITQLAHGFGPWEAAHGSSGRVACEIRAARRMFLWTQVRRT
jgi:hypothetical protein